MVINGTNDSFRSGVELKRVTSGPLKHGADVVLIASFRDFLGEPTKDTGEICITTSQGQIFLPNGHASGSQIVIELGDAIISENGELTLVLKPERSIGEVEINLTCALGQKKLELDIPAPAGYAASEMLESIIYAFLVAIVIRIFFFQTFWIPSASMEPTLYEKDRIVANKLIYRLREPHRGEVVIFRVFQPGQTQNGVFRNSGIGKLTLVEAQENVERRQVTPFRTQGDQSSAEYTVRPQDYIKRCIGLPGETVEIDDGVIYIDGSPIEETFDTRIPNYSHYGPITVPPGEIFVLGDNRSNSQDSHVIGTVPLRNVEGRAELVFWPPSRIGLIPQGSFPE